MSRYHAASARLAVDHGPTFPAWRAKARPAVEEAFSGVSEDDDSDWFAIAREALSRTLPHTMYRGLSVRAKSAAEAKRLAKAEIRKARRALPHSFSKAVAKSFAVGVEPCWAAGGAVSDSGMRARQGKAGQWGIILSVEVAPDMVDWGCLESGNAMFGEHVYDLLPFEGPPGEYMADILVEHGGVSNVEWDLEVKPYPPESARVEAFRIGPGDTEETEELWREWGKEAAREARRASALLPPARRERVKEWKLDRQRAGNETPPWEEVLGYLRTTDGWANRLEYEPDWLRREAEGDASAEHDEGTPEWDAAVEGLVRSRMEADEAAEQEDRYWDVRGDIERADGGDCWREITLREGVDPRGLRGVGEFWADDRGAAEAHWGRFGPGMRKVLLRARVDLGNVDLRGTMFARMEVDTGPDEREVRFLKHAPIWVHDAEAGGEVLEINDWRRA